MMKIEYCTQSAHYGRFDALNLSEESIKNIAYSLYSFLELVKFGIQKENFNNFVDNVKENYTYTFYHNFHHAIDVVCSTIYLMKKLKNNYKFDQTEQIGIVLGALLHDVGHYGKTGKYVSTYDKEKYEKFGKTTTLEKYHLNLGLRLIDESGIFKNVNKNCVTKIKKIIKSVILSTDPTIKINDIPINPLYNTIIRCADISSVQKLFNVHKKWSRALTKEFYLEGHDLKTKHGVKTIDQLFDSSKKNCFSKQQEGFYAFYVEPHFNKLKPYLYNYNEIWHKIQTNKYLWQKQTLLYNQ